MSESIPTGGTPPNDESRVNVNADVQDQAQVSVLGQGVQHVYFGHQPASRDVNIVLVHDGDDAVVELAPPCRRVFSIQITNYGSDARRLQLRAEGMDSVACRVETETATVASGVTVKVDLTLHTTTTRPTAGRYTVRVAAIDLDAERSLWWTSDQVVVVVKRRPDSDITKVQLTERVGRNAYAATLLVTNSGNTRESIRICGAELAGLPSTRLDRDAGLVESGRVTASAPAELAPCESRALITSITVPPRRLRNSLWKVPLAIVSTTRSGDGQPSFTSSKIFWLPIHHPGVISDVAAALPFAAASVRNAAIRLAAWGGRRAGVPRWVLTVLAALLVSTPPLAWLVNRSEAPVAVPPSSAPSVSPLGDSPGLAVPLVIRQPISCRTAKGKWVVLLASMKAGDSTRPVPPARDTLYRIEEYYRRSEYPGAPRRPLKYSPAPRDVSCPTWVSRFYVLYIGPVQDLGAAKRECNRLGWYTAEAADMCFGLTIDRHSKWATVLPDGTVK